MIIVAIIEIGASCVITVEQKSYHDWENYYIDQPQFEELSLVVNMFPSVSAILPLSETTLTTTTLLVSVSSSPKSSSALTITFVVSFAGIESSVSV